MTLAYVRVRDRGFSVSITATVALGMIMSSVVVVEVVVNVDVVASTGRTGTRATGSSRTSCVAGTAIICGPCRGRGTGGGESWEGNIGTATVVTAGESSDAESLAGLLCFCCCWYHLSLKNTTPAQWTLE